MLLANNKKCLQQLQCSNIPNAVTDNVLEMISLTPNLTFLDISFAKHVTDDGLSSFNTRTLPIKKLFVSGLTSITAHGMTSIVTACRGSLRILEAALMDQEGMNGTFCAALSLAFEIEEIDLTGDSLIGDEGILILPKGELKNEETR